MKALHSWQKKVKEKAVKKELDQHLFHCLFRFYKAVCHFKHFFFILYTGLPASETSPRTFRLSVSAPHDFRLPER